MRTRPTPLRHLILAAAVLGTASCGSVAGTALPIGSAPPGTTAPGTSADDPLTEPTTPPIASPMVPSEDEVDPEPPVDTTGADPTTADAPPVTVDGAIGATGYGDPYYPESGNGGYDVLDYLVELTYDSDAGSIDAVTTVTATVTESEKLGQFTFDLRQNMVVDAVTVNDVDTTFSQTPGKLVLTPPAGLEPDTEFVTVVSYSGVPTAISNGTAGLGDGGWTPLDDGGAIVAGEPFSSSTWFPSNEHPADRASFTVIATVPEEFSVIGNGVPITDGLPDAPAGSAVFGWQETAPMSTYLTTLYIDRFTVTNDTTSTGLPIINAFAPNGGEEFEDLAAQTAAFVEFLETKFGPYPFTSVGGIYTNEPLSFALETQTRPVYADWVDLDTVVHELAHQWYGDAVAVKTWSDICLNECFASYAPWLWYEATDDADLDDIYRNQIKSYASQTTFWERPLVDPGAGYEFTDVYARGPLALHALRREIGDEKFDAILLGWVKEKAGANASFDEWETYVSDVAGEDLSGFLTAWFRDSGIPADEYLWPGELTQN